MNANAITARAMVKAADDRAYRAGRLIMDSKQDLVDRIAALEATLHRVRFALAGSVGQQFAALIPDTVKAIDTALD